MTEHIDDALLRRFIDLVEALADADYDEAPALFDLPKDPECPPLLAKLAEAVGHLVLKVEAREYRIGVMLDELRENNTRLTETLERIAFLEQVRGHLVKFVPRSVQHSIESSPETPDLEKREQDVTVLFLDVAGYTRLCESVAVDEANFIIEKYFSAFLDDIHAHHGDINETAGDGLMIIFRDGAAQEHALGAVRTALAVQTKVEAINTELFGRFDELTVNVGINSGTALVGSTRFRALVGDRWTFTATGAVTNIAARIGALARNGEIFIGPETARRVRGEVTLEDLGLMSLKNVREPIRLHRVVSAKPHRLQALD